jgi:5-methylcytosine-specific restriction protein B
VAIPTNINKEHLLNAIAKIDQEGVPSDAGSHYYDLVFRDKRYPPKLVISYGNLYANGSILDRSSFPGGNGTQCFRILEANGFTIEKKRMGYYQELRKFLAQASTSDLKTLGYVQTYQGLDVSVSFGQGNPARVPWIAFLADGQTVMHGIYPVYLFYKDKNLLILAYGVSETNQPNSSWNLSGAKDINTYFGEAGLGKPVRYGKSLVFKVYSTPGELDEDRVESDLDTIIRHYKDNLPETIQSEPNAMFDYQQFVTKCKEVNFVASEHLCLRYIASLLTKPFVILTGLSGSGKTKLALTFSKWIAESESQICVVPVGADWTNRDPLLGYSNALEKGRYVLPESGALQIILEASKPGNESKPYFLILDEMNLSHVERYFADFLSAMESGQAIKLHSDPEPKDALPQSISLPKNLFIVGTVNIDETTYMFSPKVLDRANVIEFQVTASEMNEFLKNPRKMVLGNLVGAGRNYAKAFISAAGNVNSIEGTLFLTGALMEFFNLLKKTGFEFGYRSASEIQLLATVLKKLKPGLSENEIVDIAVMQKLLPKVHGSRRKLEPVLKIFGAQCSKNGEGIQAILDASQDPEPSVVKYPLSLSKIRRMYKGLLDNGFTSYAEA